MRELDRGEDFVVTRNGVPVGELRPIGRRHFVSRDTIAKAFAGAPRIDYQQFREDIDAYVDQDPTPRFRRDP
jgi:antitoxin (DNA-binding transcriptional repressor) of toxin-antitoxin stability system